MSTKKNITHTVENTFLHKVDTYLKLPFQKIFLELIRWLTFDLFQTGFRINQNLIKKEL